MDWPAFCAAMSGADSPAAMIAALNGFANHLASSPGVASGISKPQIVGVAMNKRKQNAYVPGQHGWCLLWAWPDSWAQRVGPCGAKMSPSASEVSWRRINRRRWRYRPQLLPHRFLQHALPAQGLRAPVTPPMVATTARALLPLLPLPPMVRRVRVCLRGVRVHVHMSILHGGLRLTPFVLWIGSELALQAMLRRAMSGSEDSSTFSIMLTSHSPLTPSPTPRTSCARTRKTGSGPSSATGRPTCCT